MYHYKSILIVYQPLIKQSLQSNSFVNLF